jgi:hypothetical protein
MPVRSIEAMPSVRLSYRRAEVVPFWILGTVVASLSLGLVSAFFGSATPSAWAAAGGAGLLLPGLFWTPWWQNGIWVWNGVLRRSAIALRRYVLAVCYYTVFAAVSRVSPRLDLVPPQTGASGWRGSRHERAVQPVPDLVEWYHGLHACAKNPGNAWIWCLLPPLFLLILLREEHLESVPPGSTYTLY